MKPKNGSYPYLRIAKEFNLDYGDVLLANEWCAGEETGQPHRICVKEAVARVRAKLDNTQMLALGKALKEARDEFAIIRKEGWD